MRKSFDVILFDLGGVLIELGASPLPAYALPDDNGFNLANWFRSNSSIAFEKGLSSPAEFAASFKDELGLNCSTEQLLDHFRDWPVGLFEGVGELLSQLRPDYRLAVLTNTNELHWPRFIDEFGLAGHVDHIFASHQLQMAKPAAEIFHHVIDNLSTPANRILFFDDNPSNVEAAGESGMQAFLVQGFEQLQQQLRAQGISSDRG